ncbi:MAG: acyl-protein synthetase [Clostridia bacterium]|nr:acyl-protein synthetase [Clostridia bacterium]
MDNRKKLFTRRDPYKNNDQLREAFLAATRSELSHHIKNCPEYARIAEKQGFRPDDIRTEADLAKIPVIPTLYLKRNRLFSVPESELAVRASSSGTKGSASTVGIDKKSLSLGMRMMTRFFSYHKVISLIPCNYVILSYEPGATDLGAAKTAYGTSKFAPALHREYCLKAVNGKYELNIEGVQKALLRYAKSPFPVRFVGFPAYMYFLARSLRDRGVSLKLNKKSMVILGGGWKQFSGEEIGREAFCALINETLGIGRERILEFYSAAEHPLAYARCSCGHFHVPAYSRVIIRSAYDLSPVENGQTGLLSFVSPLVHSMPITSVVTDDLAVYSDEPCGCGNPAPYFDLIGRAGVSGITTCAAAAAETLGKGAAK